MEIFYLYFVKFTIHLSILMCWTVNTTKNIFTCFDSDESWGGVGRDHQGAAVTALAAEHRWTSLSLLLSAAQCFIRTGLRRGTWIHARVGHEVPALRWPAGGVASSHAWWRRRLQKKSDGNDQPGLTEPGDGCPNVHECILNVGAHARASTRQYPFEKYTHEWNSDELITWTHEGQMCVIDYIQYENKNSIEWQKK